jgi:exonuclease III
MRFTNSLRDNKNKSYEAIFNSNSNRRGVAILFGTNLKFEKLNVYADQAENIIAVHCKINDYELMLCSIYGPNNTDRSFFRNLTQFLNTVPNIPMILGGDWNTVFDTSTVGDNIDILNMQRIPNLN